MVLKVPIVSISMTALKPFGVRAERGEMKLPAAPALGMLLATRFAYGGPGSDEHDEIDGPKLLYTAVRGTLEAVKLYSNVSTTLH
jgi:hypothetical protein